MKTRKNTVKKSKILFVVNTLGRAGAETALLELLRHLDSPEYEISLYVIMGQGVMINELPSHVRLMNTRFSNQSVLTKKGKRIMMRTVCTSFLRNGGWFRKLRFIMKNYTSMSRTGHVQPDKLLWRMISDGSPHFSERFDMAVAYLEGASAYYVAEHVKADRKCAFVHIDYESAGYTREMDQGCWERFDRIFTVSDEVRSHFLVVYPECSSKTEIFHNLIDQEGIRKRAEEEGGFQDTYQGMRLLTVGRLTYQKAYDITVEAMKLLKDAGLRARWYVLGEGDQRSMLEKKIASLGLKEDFVLLGAVANPYPYYAQADLYIHATRFEGKSIAIQEAQTLGRTVIASDCNGNREQIIDGEDGILCELTPQAIADSIADLLKDHEKRKRLGQAAAKKTTAQKEEIEKLLRVLPGGQRS